MQNINEKLKDVDAEHRQFRKDINDERKHRDQMAVQGRSATAAEKTANIAKWSLGVAAVALFLSSTGWSIPVIVNWFRSLSK